MEHVGTLRDGNNLDRGYVRTAAAAVEIEGSLCLHEREPGTHAKKLTR